MYSARETNLQSFNDYNILVKPLLMSLNYGHLIDKIVPKIQWGSNFSSFTLQTTPSPEPDDKPKLDLIVEAAIAGNSIDKLALHAYLLKPNVGPVLCFGIAHITTLALIFSKVTEITATNYNKKHALWFRYVHFNNIIKRFGNDHILVWRNTPK